MRYSWSATGAAVLAGVVALALMTANPAGSTIPDSKLAGTVTFNSSTGGKAMTFRLAEFEWGVTTATTIGGGTGGPTAGPAEFEQMSLAFEISNKAPLIWSQAAIGGHFDEVVIKVTNPSTGKTAFRYKLKTVFVSSYTETKGGPKPASIDLALIYRQIRQIAYKADGVSVASSFCYDVPEDSVCGTN